MVRLRLLKRDERDERGRRRLVVELRTFLPMANRRCLDNNLTIRSDTIDSFVLVDKGEKKRRDGEDGCVQLIVQATVDLPRMIFNNSKYFEREKPS